MKKAAIILVFVMVFLSSCTNVEVVNLTMISNETINTTKLEKNESRYAEEGLKELPEDVKEGLCTEKVLLAIRKCRWLDDANNLGITIKNNGFKDITMAFYLYDTSGNQIGSLLNDTLFPVKEEWTFKLPFHELEEQYGPMKKIHATPLLTEGNQTISCSNKKLPVLVSGCS